MPRSRRISADFGFGGDSLVGTVIRRNALVRKIGSLCSPVAAGGFAAGASVRRKPSRLEAHSRISDPILLFTFARLRGRHPDGGAGRRQRQQRETHGELMDWIICSVPLSLWQISRPFSAFQYNNRYCTLF
jgi:hypothetical protein